MKTNRIIAIMAVLASLLSSCSSVPITGRHQLNMVSEREVLQASLTQYSSYMKNAKISEKKSQCEMVSRVGRRIAAATEAYLNSHGLSNEVKNFAWEFNLVKNKEINAFCMPGGKIVVYEGLMDIVSSDDELAVVLGHEVAHAVAKHSQERMSQQVLAQYGAQALSIFTQGKSSTTQAVANQVFGLGANYGVMLPFSRKHESEADKMGLVFMSIAGYNPDCALTFWKKMSASGNGNRSDFFSSHPSDAKRIAAIQKELPAIRQQYARGTYAGNGGRGAAGKQSTTQKKSSTRKKSSTKR